MVKIIEIANVDLDLDLRRISIKSTEGLDVNVSFRWIDSQSKVVKKTFMVSNIGLR